MAYYLYHNIIGVCFIRVNNCGMNFEWSLFHFTPNDCKNLCQAVKSSKQLTVLRLHHSQVSDDQARLLISYLLDHPILRELGGYDLYTVIPLVIGEGRGGGGRRRLLLQNEL